MFQYIEIFNKKITTYTIMFLIGIFFCGILIFRMAKKNKIDTEQLLGLILVSFIGVFVGSHLLYAIVNYKLIISFISNIHNVKNVTMFFQCLYEIFGGSVFYGGLLGGLLTGYIYCRKNKMDIDVFSNLIAPFIPLFHMFGRVGCFLTGCCHGIESKIGIDYPIYQGQNIIIKQIFPVQLVEAGFNLIIFLVLYNFFKKNKPYLMNLYLMLYAIVRFILEFFRGDIARGFLLGFSTSQIISLIIFIFSIFSFIKKKKARVKTSL